MKKLTLQQVFDTGVNGVLKQGRKSTNSFGDFCLYRGKNGMKCVIDHSINDEEYKEEMKYTDILDICHDFKNRLPKTLLLRKLQYVHDRACDSKNHDYCYNFLKKAIKFAEENNLSIENIEYELVEPTGVYKND